MYPTDAILLSMWKSFYSEIGKNRDFSSHNNNNHKKETEKYTQPVTYYVILLHKINQGLF